MSLLVPARPDPAAAPPAASDPATAPATRVLPDGLVGVLVRLYDEFACCLPPSRVREVVAGCLSDIQATSAAALPELTERLARHRLAEAGHRHRS